MGIDDLELSKVKVLLALAENRFVRFDSVVVLKAGAGKGKISLSNSRSRGNLQLCDNLHCSVNFLD